MLHPLAPAMRLLVRAFFFCWKRVCDWQAEEREPREEVMRWRPSWLGQRPFWDATVLTNCHHDCSSVMCFLSIYHHIPLMFVACTQSNPEGRLSCLRYTLQCSSMLQELKDLASNPIEVFIEKHRQPRSPAVNPLRASLLKPQMIICSVGIARSRLL